MTTLLFIRHGNTDYAGNRLVGWMPGIFLNESGQAQAQRLAERLANAGINAVYSSPLERTIETAEPLARRLGLEIQTSPDLGEIRFGDWTGRPVTELVADPHWKRYNSHRSITRIPGGESMLEVQARMLTAANAISTEHRDQVTAVFSHGDPIRSILMHYLGMPLDFIHRLEVRTASVSVVHLRDAGAQVFRINDTGELP